MPPRIDVENSVISYLTARPSRNILNAAAESLAKRLLVDGAIPRTEPEDALQVAIAVVH